MTALTKDMKADQMDTDSVIPRLRSFPVAAATSIFGGSMVAKNTSGYAVPASADATLKIIGRCEKQTLNTVAAGFGNAGDLQVPVRQGVFYYNNGTGTNAITAADVGKGCYASDDNTVNLTDGAGLYPFAGEIYDLRSDGKVGVLLGKPVGAILDDEDLTTGDELFAVAVATSALAAYTVTAGAMQANANGALGAVFDGVTVAVGDTILLPAGIAAAVADAGPWVITSLGAAGAKFTMVRPDWWAHGSNVVRGAVIQIGAAGTLFKGTEWKTFVTTATVVVGTSDPLLYPKRVVQSITLVAGTATISNVSVRSTTLTSVIATRTVANTSTDTTGGYHATNGGANGITAGALGTASIILQATVAAGTINAADVSTLNVVVENA